MLQKISLMANDPSSLLDASVGIGALGLCCATDSMSEVD